MTKPYYDIIVIGAGHAGCEAALAAARLGAKTLLITMNNDHIAQMSCNPAIGGIAKGQVVCEIDALGGEMALNTDASSIQFRMLNLSKGPAVQSPRAQCDKLVYQKRMKMVLEHQKNLYISQGQVVKITTNKDSVTGVVTEFGEHWLCKSIIVATGTFLKGTLHYGLQHMDGGRSGDFAAKHLSDCLRNELGFEVKRLKTGTPARISGKSMDLAELSSQTSDVAYGRFSAKELNDDLPKFHGMPGMPQLKCYTTYSTAKTAEIIHENIHLSPMYSGKISGTGARYCPSFEDKIIRFPHHETHQIQIEPEGLFTDEYYLNGISTSLPPEVQWKMIRTLPGLENAHITRYAYAIEYDFIPPYQLLNTLATIRWPNLFLAGQINGTSGYEEAAGQGLIAGINAVRFIENKEGIVLGRDEAYIGVMIDDLVTKEIIEPYRLFTSRAEYRLMLRQDNADQRLTKLGYDLGLVQWKQYKQLLDLEDEISRVRQQLQTQREKENTLWELLQRPEVTYKELPGAPIVSAKISQKLKTEAMYFGYIERQKKQAASMKRLEVWEIPQNFNYDNISGLSNECRQKLVKLRPQNLSQASRIDGVTPAEISLLQVYLRRITKK